MKRVRDTLPANHTLRDRFMSRLRDLLFSITDVDIQEEMMSLMKDGWSKDQVEDLYNSNYVHFVRKARRLIPKPQVLLRDLEALIRVYTPTVQEPLRGYCPSTRTWLLEKPATTDKLATLQYHISNGCLSDPENVALYVDISRPGQRCRWHCMRGTSALEGFHAHIRRFFVGHAVSPRLAQSLLICFVYRWNHRAHVKNRRGAIIRIWV